VKAIVIREFGGPDVLRLEDVPVPTLGPDDVLIRVAAVSINRTLDLVVRSGKYPRPVTLPHVLGADPSGTIVAVGDGVTDRKPGDRVATSPRLKPPTATEPPVMLGVQVWGGNAEFVKVPAAATHLIPDGLDFVQATIVARHAPLAYNLLRDVAQLRVGEWVLVMGAAGGLGGMGVQVARRLGARVIAAAGAPERVRAAMRLGADFGIDYRAENLAARVREITGNHGVGVVFENVGDPALFQQAFKSIGRNGRLVTAGAHAGGLVPLDLSHLYLNAIKIVGSTVHTNADVEASLAAAADGALRGDVDCILDLKVARLGHERAAAREGIGKIILRPSSESGS
jgi:NADPH2:quinone reductase